MLKTSSKIKKLLPIFGKYPQIKLVYLFGSRAEEKIGPLSDYDLAFYLEEKSAKKRFDLKLELFKCLSQALKTDAIDIVILNDAKGSELKYNIIKEGKLIYQKEPYKVLIEPKILNEYFDFYAGLLRYNLTQA